MISTKTPLCFLVYLVFILLSAQAVNAEEPLDGAILDPEITSGDLAEKTSEETGFSRLDRINDQSSDVMVTESEQTFLRALLWYIPNRVVDLFDIFRADVGVGPAAGVVIRATRYGQVGGRIIHPTDIRLGLRGREFPYFLERDEEYGFGPNFEQSSQRHVTPFEIGVGVDLGVGAYVGISLDELVDFLGGFIFIDVKNDDLVR